LKTFFIIYFTILFLLYLRVSFLTRNRKVNQLNIGKKKLVNDVLEFCITNFPSKRQVSFQIRYYQHTKVMGRYEHHNRLIIIYISNDVKVFDLVDTILHEYFHHLDIVNKKSAAEYSRLLNEIGYDNHPMEVTARNFAKQHRLKCFETYQKTWF